MIDRRPTKQELQDILEIIEKSVSAIPEGSGGDMRDWVTLAGNLWEYTRSRP